MYQSRTIFKGVLLSAAAVVVESKKSKDENEQQQLLCKPSELPIYTPEAITNTIAKNVQEEATPGSLEVAISSVRRQFTNIYYEIKAYERVGEQYIQESRENAEWLLKYLREEDNTTPKAGAIAIGGMTGLIFGLRGGLIKRTIYATTGALGMAAVCYPKEASEYSQAALVEARKYATIAYNFAYGVKKDDPPLELPSLPKLPDSFSSAWGSVSKSASSLVLGADTDEQKSVKSESKPNVKN